MWRRQTAATIVGAVFAATSVLGAEEIRVMESHPVAAASSRPSEGTSHELRLFLYVFEGGRWDRDVAVKAALEAASLLRQCGVALSSAELSIIKAPSRFRYYATEASRELLRRLPVSKPAIFFVDDTLNSPSYDAEAIGRANAATRPELADTVWVAHGARDLPIALAHELVHVLSDSGQHSEEPGNLLGDATSPQSTRLTAEQCREVRTRAGANGLLHRRADKR